MYRNGFSFSLLIIIAPSNAPIVIAGIILPARSVVFKVILCQKKICSGSLDKFIMKKNQAAVPIKLFFLKPIVSKYILNIGPAALPIMEVNPLATPAKIGNHAPLGTFRLSPFFSV